MLKVKDLLCTSNSGNFAHFSRSNLVGSLLDTLISPLHISAVPDGVSWTASAGAVPSGSPDLFMPTAGSYLGGKQRSCVNK